MEYLLKKPSEKFTEKEYQMFMKTASFMVRQFQEEIQTLKTLEKDISAGKQKIIDQAKLCLIMEKDLEPFLQKAEDLLQREKRSLNPRGIEH